MAAKKSVDTTVFDVSKPKQGAPPLKVGKRAVIKPADAPVVEEAAKESPAATASHAKKVVIKPLHESVAETAVEPTPEPPESNSPEPPKGFPEPVENAAVKPEAQPGVPAEKADREADDEIARKRTERLKKMIEEEEYFLPIQTVEERRSRKVAVFGLILIIILAAAWYDAALDANLLPNTYNLPHTTFFTVK